MLKTLGQLYNDRIEKGGPGSGRRPEGGAKAKPELSTPSKRKLSEAEAFHNYVKIKDGAWGNSAQAKMLNAKVGAMEGRAKAYRERAGQMKLSPERHRLLFMAKRLSNKAIETASMRDSLLGRPAHKMLKQELSEQDIIDMIDSGEFNDAIEQEIDAEFGGLDG